MFNTVFDLYPPKPFPFCVFYNKVSVVFQRTKFKSSETILQDRLKNAAFNVRKTISLMSIIESTSPQSS